MRIYFSWDKKKVVYLQMMKATQDYIINEIKQILHSVAPNAKAILFGSRARNDAREDSDWDILILLEKDKIRNEKCSKALKEVYIVLKVLGDEVKDKIPKNVLEFIEENMDKKYFFMLNDTVALEEQNLMEESLGIISLLWRDYICSPEEKKRLKEQDAKIKIFKSNEKYNYDDLFNKKRSRTEKIKEQENLALVEKKETIFDRIISFLKRIFIKE